MTRFGRVALLGRPNAGKSTLLNRMVGQKISIVSDKPQTTRNRILGLTLHGDTQIAFLDLPGVHKPAHKLNNRMMGKVHQGLDEAQLILHLVDATTPAGKGDHFVAEMIAQHARPVILVLNKIDLINRNRLIGLLDQWNQAFHPAEIIPISSTTGENVDALLNLVSAQLPEGPWAFAEDDLTDQPLRFIAQELIREKILHFTREELPHASAVTIGRFEEGEADQPWVIEATLWVERANQRMILLGAQGAMISKIRSAAKRSLKQLLGKAGELELMVRVSEHWRQDRTFLQGLD
jgi:GTP-binding protein Era